MPGEGNYNVAEDAVEAVLPLNQELYKLTMKQLNALDVKKLTDVEVRHVEDPADEYGVKENRIQIDIYYNE